LELPPYNVAVVSGVGTGTTWASLPLTIEDQYFLTATRHCVDGNDILAKAEDLVRTLACRLSSANAV